MSAGTSDSKAGSRFPLHTHHVLGVDYTAPPCAASLPMPGGYTLVRNPQCGLDHEDMCLMIQCQHHIVANSSFSWWGATLARSERQMVFCPERWVTPLDMNAHAHGNLFPPKWESLPG